jgi:hypothetical protein
MTRVGIRIFLSRASNKNPLAMNAVSESKK